MSGHSQNGMEPAPFVGIGRGALPSMQPSSGAHYSPPAGAAAYAPNVMPNYAVQSEGRGRGIAVQSNVQTAQPREKPKKPGVPRMKPVTPLLIKQYDDGTKNPISAVNEYCQVNRLIVAFNEVPAEGRFLTASFAYQCVINGRSYLQGVAKTKKDAKTVAARNAFNDIIDETEASQADGDNFEDVEDESTDDELKTDQTTDKYALGNRHPVMMLNEYATKKGMNLEVKVHDVRTDYGFRCDVIIDERLFKTAHANSKQEAKRLAGDEAIRELLANDALSQTETENLMHFDVMRNLVREKLEELWVSKGFPQTMARPSRCAAFIIKRSPEHRGEVVALGTGSNCLTGRHVKFNGRVVFDCHAEVIARRALIKWFYTQINFVFTPGEAAKSVFEINEETDKLRLRESISLHLYVSGAPCGDAAAFHDAKNTILGEEEKRLIMEGEHLPNFEDKAYGQLRVKLEFGLTTTPVVRLANELSYETYFALSKESNRAANRKEEGDEQLRSMSCSDKIFKWNLLGVQGSLLSLYLEPVYINSITLGSEFNLGHLVRAVCCRLPSHVSFDDLPEGYVGDRHPIVGRVSIYDAPGPEKPSGQQVSVNWVWEETNPLVEKEKETNALVEIVDCATGLSVPESPFKTGSTFASRLCKAGFFHRFNKLAVDTQQTHYLRPMYRDTKQVATTYNRVKEILYSEIERAGQGRWITRPNEVEVFGS